MVVAAQMLLSDLVNQQKTASAVHEEGERIIASQTSVEASSSTRDALRQLDDSLALLGSRLGQRVDELTAALSEVRLAVRLIVIDVVVVSQVTFLLQFFVSHSVLSLYIYSHS